MAIRETKRVTMRQIAARAHVSVGTVSHVINNTAGVREPVRRRVLEAIERLGYQPSLLARGLRRNQTTIIGVIIPDISNPFFPLVVRGVEDIAYQNSYRLMLCNADNDAQKEQVYFDELRAYRMAGLIVIPSANSRLVAAAGTAGELPVICLDRCPEGWKGDSITVDNAEGAYQATRYLLGLGHRGIAAIAGQLHVTSAVERLKGFKRALRESGITIAPEYIQEGRFDRLSGYEKSLMLLQFSPRPTAIFAANDLVALGVLAAMRELGLRCPEDVSLAGFDDLEIASFTNPALTTVAQPAYQMGARAAALLFERLRGENLPAQHIVMNTSLKVRDSTAAPSRGQ
ncbi:MAG TPA: LacI family DNA-binding transcriptional regulator [Terriglobales bacterium]|jgi:LacI family transcriptional regulator|nr:LacI family DNA-binding transcriptional regulator [Terriglobales bacterium]